MNKPQWRTSLGIRSDIHHDALLSSTGICNGGSHLPLKLGVKRLAPHIVSQPRSPYHAPGNCTMAGMAAPISTVAPAPTSALQQNPMLSLRRVWQPSCGTVFSPVNAAATRMARPPPRRDLTWRPSSRIVFSPPPDNGPAAKSPNRIDAPSRRELSSMPTAAILDRTDGSAAETAAVREYEDESDDGGSEYLSMPSQEADLHSPASSSVDSLVDATQNLRVEQTYAPLAYRISESELETARKAKTGDDVLYWSWHLYRSPDGDKVTRHYCKAKEQSEREAAAFLEDKMLGFDLEWKMQFYPGQRSFKEEVSTIQLASETRIALFHVALHEGSTPEEVLPPSLKRILESPEYLKAGVNVRGDINRLRKHWNLNPAGYFELSHLYKLVKYSETEPRKVNKRLVSLASQVEEVLGMPLAKDEVRVSDWSRELKIDQIDYACSDAYAAVHLFGELNTQRMQLVHVPPLPDFLERDMPIRFTVRTEQGESLEVQSRDNSETEGDGDGDGNAAAAAAAVEGEKTPQDAAPAAAAVATTVSPEVEASVSSARTWAETYRQERTASGQALRASNSHLVAYRLWHEQQFSLAAVAAHMSTRPLQMSTVSSYVLECIRLEKLPFEKTRLDECLSKLPPQIAGRKYGGLLKQRK